jgi:hypothetical protein
MIASPPYPDNFFKKTVSSIIHLYMLPSLLGIPSQTFIKISMVVQTIAAHGLRTRNRHFGPSLANILLPVLALLDTISNHSSRAVKFFAPSFL